MNPVKIQEDKACMHRGSSWIHEKAFGIHSTKRSSRSHRRKRIQFDKSWKFGTQFSDASSDGNSGGEDSSVQGMEEARNDTSLAIGQNEEQKGCYSGSTKNEEKGPVCYTYEILLSFRLYWLCVNKRTFETPNNRVIPDWRHQWHDMLIRRSGRATSKLGTKGLEQE